MLHRRTRPAFLAFLLLQSAALSAAGVDPAQIRTVEIPPSQPEPIPLVPEPGDPVTPAIDTSEKLHLDLPTLEEARARDAARGRLAGPTGGVAELDAKVVAGAIAAAESARLRTANTEQLAAARRQLDRIATDKRAERDRLARYREAEAAYAATMADYNAQVEAARVARQRWERDVAACAAGDRNRCGPRFTPE